MLYSLGKFEKMDNDGTPLRVNAEGDHDAVSLPDAMGQTLRFVKY